MWCFSLERQTCKALNSSNPTPIPAHAFGHFPTTGSLTVHTELSGIHSYPSFNCVCVFVGVCVFVCVHAHKCVSLY